MSIAHLPDEPILLRTDIPAIVHCVQTAVRIRLVAGRAGLASISFEGDTSSAIADGLRVDYDEAHSRIVVSQPRSARLRPQTNQDSTGTDIAHPDDVPTLTIAVPEGSHAVLDKTRGLVATNDLYGSLQGMAYGSIFGKGVDHAHLESWGGGKVVLTDVTGAVDITKSIDGDVVLKQLDVADLKIHKSGKGDVHVDGHFVQGHVETQGNGTLNMHDASFTELTGAHLSIGNLAVHGTFDPDTMLLRHPHTRGDIQSTGPYEPPRRDPVHVDSAVETPMAIGTNDTTPPPPHGLRRTSAGTGTDFGRQLEIEQPRPSHTMPRPDTTRPDGGSFLA